MLTFWVPGAASATASTAVISCASSARPDRPDARRRSPARAESGTTGGPRAVIMVCLAGGPSHIDMYDLKPDAPSDFRGEFKPIRTNVPGFDMCELFPMQARIADKLALVRTVQFVEPMQHELEEVYTGFPKSAKRPAFGSVVSRFGGGTTRTRRATSASTSTRRTIRGGKSAVRRRGPSAVPLRRRGRQGSAPYPGRQRGPVGRPHADARPVRRNAAADRHARRLCRAGCLFRPALEMITSPNARGVRPEP